MWEIGILLVVFVVLSLCDLDMYLWCLPCREMEAECIHTARSALFAPQMMCITCWYTEVPKQNICYHEEPSKQAKGKTTADVPLLNCNMRWVSITVGQWRFTFALHGLMPTLHNVTSRQRCRPRTVATAQHLPLNLILWYFIFKELVFLFYFF